MAGEQVAEYTLWGVPVWIVAIIGVGIILALALIIMIIYFKFIKQEQVFMPRAIEYKDSLTSARIMKPPHIDRVFLRGDSTHPSKMLGKCVGFNPQPFTGFIPADDGLETMDISVDEGGEELTAKKVKILSKEQMRDRGYAIINDVVFKPNIFTTRIARVFDCSIMDKEYNPLTKKFEWVPPVGDIEIKGVGFRIRGYFLIPNHYFDDDDVILSHMQNRVTTVAFERFMDTLGKLTTKALRIDEEFVKRQKSKQISLYGRKNEGQNQPPQR